VSFELLSVCDYLLNERNLRLEGKVAVLGSSDFVMPFAALGLDIFCVEAGGQDLSDAVDEILSKKYTMIIVAENIAVKIKELFERTSQRILPSVVVVPFTTEPQGFAVENLGRLLKTATGIDIVSN